MSFSLFGVIIEEFCAVSIATQNSICAHWYKLSEFSLWTNGGGQPTFFYLIWISNKFQFLAYSRPNQRTFFEVLATVDIRSDRPTSLNELDTIIKRALESGQLGGIRVKRDESYSLLPIRGNFTLNISSTQLMEYYICIYICFLKWFVRL